MSTPNKYDLDMILREAKTVIDQAKKRNRKYKCDPERYDPEHGTMRVPAELVVELVEQVISTGAGQPSKLSGLQSSVFLRI